MLFHLRLLYCIVSQVLSSVCVQLLERKKNNSEYSTSSPVSKPLNKTVIATPRVLENPTIRNARHGWEDGINEELLSIASEKDRPFVLLM